MNGKHKIQRVWVDDTRVYAPQGRGHQAELTWTGTRGNGSG